jgi:hypothetical protein
VTDAKANATKDVAFFWSAVDTLPSDWEIAVKRALNHADHPGLLVKVVKVGGDDEVAVYTAWSEHVPAAYFHFPRGRGAGEVLRVAGDLAVVAALRIGQVLGLDLSDKDGNAFAKDRPLEWLSTIDFTGPADEVEALAEQLGLIAKRYGLAELTRPDAEKETRLFF